MAKNVETTANKKELEDLVSALGENRLPLRKPCMQGTRTAILQEIENDIKNVNGHALPPRLGFSCRLMHICRQQRRFLKVMFTLYWNPRSLKSIMSLNSDYDSSAFFNFSKSSM